MAKRITELTNAQASQMAAWRDKWIRIGLSTEGMQGDDKREVDQAIRAMYRKANLREPKSVIFVPSPLSLRIAAGIAAGTIYASRANHRGAVRGGIGDVVDDEISASVRGTVGGAVGAAIGGAIHVAVRSAVHVAIGGAVHGVVDGAVGGVARGAVYDAVGGAIGGEVGNAIRDLVEDAINGAFGDAVHGTVRNVVGVRIGDAIGEAVHGAVRGAVGRAVHHVIDGLVDAAADGTFVRFLSKCAYAAYRQERFGWWWTGWCAWASFFRDVCGLDIAEWDTFAAIETTQTRSGFPISLHTDFAMVSDRPSILRRDAGGRLHNDRGPAMAWRDGWKLYFWHGLGIPRSHEWAIETPGKITPENIEAEPNAELRRVLLELFGFDKYLAVREATVIAEDELHGFPRRLLEMQIGGELIRIIEVTNGSLEPDGSRRKFHLGAMRGRTPHEALAASYGISPRYYREAIRT